MLMRSLRHFNTTRNMGSGHLWGVPRLRCAGMGNGGGPVKARCIDLSARMSALCSQCGERTAEPHLIDDGNKMLVRCPRCCTCATRKSQSPAELSSSANPASTSVNA